jgi:hypothetical protein
MVLVKTISYAHAITLGKGVGQHTATVGWLKFLEKQLLRAAGYPTTLRGDSRNSTWGNRCGVLLDLGAPDLYVGALPQRRSPRPGDEATHEIVDGVR